MNEIKIFENKDFGKIKAIELDGEWRFELYSVGMALGQVKEAKGNFYPRKERIDENVKNAEIEPVVHNGQLWITEPEMYDLMFETHTEKVKPFKKWVTSEILPSIRKTGEYRQDNTGDVQGQIKLLAQGTTELYQRVDELDKKLLKSA